MPNADAHNTQEMLWQVDAELRQIHAQIDSINATIKPWQEELVSLKDYRKQLIDLQETLQRRAVKPRVVTVERKCTTRVTMNDPATQQLLDVLKGFSPDDLAALCKQISTDNGELDNNNNLIETLED